MEVHVKIPQDSQVPATGTPIPPLSRLGADLLQISKLRRGWSLSLPFICLAAYILFASLGYWPLAILATVVLSFFTYGSISHDLVHGSLGLRRRTNDVLLSLIELVALRSGHAYQAAHLHHHARYPLQDDVEGAAARMSLPRTLLEGVIHQVRIYRWAVRREGSRRTWIVVEGSACLALYLSAAALIPVTPAPAVYVVLMTMGAWIIPLITSYIPHVPDGADVLRRTRVFRGVVASVVALEHLYHLEHHLYPRVPHHNWPALAKRLDPYLAAAGVRPIKFWF